MRTTRRHGASAEIRLDRAEHVEHPEESEDAPRRGAETDIRSTVHRHVASVRFGRFSRLALAVVVLLCGLTLIAGFVNKDRCTGPTFNADGRTTPNYSERTKEDACYSDIHYLWIARGVHRHLFPYLSGGIDSYGQLVGDTLEYPVLTGVLIWAGGYFANNDAQFLAYSAILLAPFGLYVGWALGRLARWRALIWALGPPLVLYAFHNWDLAVVACHVAAIYVLHRGWGRAGAARPLLRRARVCAVLLGIGFALKLYTAMFVLPLMLYVLTGGLDGRELPAGKRYDVAGAVKVGLAAMATGALINLPFALAGFDGWRASFVFQQERVVDVSTNSIWYWGFRPYSEPGNKGFQDFVDLASPLLILLAVGAACAIGWWRYRREGTFPWLAVSSAMLCAFLLLHKVHSPQYTLWLLPLFVLMRVRLGWVLAYLVADMAMGIGIFEWFYRTESGAPSGISNGFSAQAVVIGVWGRAALLVGLFPAFARARSVVDPEPDIPFVDRAAKDDTAAQPRTG
ncbi:MAG: glycosyltransferase family 87 protein [Sciscionella sp.]